MAPLAPTGEADLRRLLGLPERGADAVEREMNGLPHLPADMRLERHVGSVEARDARQAKSAAETLGKIPGEAESVHIVISGTYSLWHMVPAALELAGCSIDTLHVATLGFSKRNIAAMAEMVDAGQIGSVRLLCSHYFKNTSKAEYANAVETFQARPDRMRFLSIRTHAKMILVALTDGRRLTVESSANLRSCKNIEQATLFGSPAVYNFHRGWIDGLFAKGAANP